MATTSELHDIAKKAARIFARYGLGCCLTGGVACALYGTTRSPNGVDLVVLTSEHEQEELKRMLVAADAQFYLVPSKDPFATYKVDLLAPGIMHIPDVPARRVETIRGLPAMPLMLLLLMKLQAWTDHRDSPKHYMRPKQWDDVHDIAQLLDVAAARGETLGAQTRWLPADFVDAGMRRIREHVASFPETKAKWKAVGYGHGVGSRAAVTSASALSSRQQIAPEERRVLPTRTTPRNWSAHCGLDDL
ncbi:hypothetical protein DAEQUDRAFT_770676 [Daedalea quercina L-15889]|uniref:Nucleotidyltransferase n=1 Tax=Daedalea quercina L-15889 TaxID=1314783 RepID=A0A165KNR9_9APHY|nr:hypothetical protein DAEQUDRAFT_770676 [Daedalea quercina L-15889]